MPSNIRYYIDNFKKDILLYIFGISKTDGLHIPCFKNSFKMFHDIMYFCKLILEPVYCPFFTHSVSKNLLAQSRHSDFQILTFLPIHLLYKFAL